MGQRLAGSGFETVIGRGLIDELPHIAHRPYLVVTMADLWPRFQPAFDEGLGGPYLVQGLELDRLTADAASLPACRSIIGLGGGQAVDVAKFFSWQLGLPLFQAPTALTVNAPFGHRSGLRVDGAVRYLGWAVPQAVYVDLDVIASAPPGLNRSGVGDVLCYHTAAADWKLAHDRGREEARWPYDAELVAEARDMLDLVHAHLDEIRSGSEAGVRALTTALRWGGAAFHAAGWNPRHIEGVDHFLFYNLERLTGKHFIHGQPVGLGIYVGSVLQDNDPDGILASLHRVGLDIRPEAMGLTWEIAAEAIRTLGSFSRQAGLWYTIAQERPASDALIAEIQRAVEAMYGPWPEAA